MRLTLHTVICCCVFTTVLPLVKGAKGDLNTSLKKRYRVWLQSRVKRDLRNSLVTANEECSDTHVGLQQDSNAKVVSPPSSFELNIRPRRSTSSKSSGCALVTCAYQDLLHQLHQINQWQKKTTAPERKIGSKGYGRRRRRSFQDVTQLALQTGRQRRSTEAASKMSLANETEDNPRRSSLTCP
ncbi:pro-adrenomedullin [Chelmon rostratus]|uniref:pro-adrenomedullin n=1 Tax=Chelmon rostratus TaxID=109905 RepID=UPI001BE9AE6D|nr:pro-adrenomedullin [Chelmon rostratus]